MRLMKLAWSNFKSSISNYLSMILSLSFTVLIFYNFQNVLASDTFAVLGERNKQNIDLLIRVVSFVLVCFMLFFIWYATNVFLTKRKKEIGIYIFMGLSNQKIGMLYAIETFFIGVTAMLTGIFCGLLTAKLFQMILLALSDITVDIQFQFHQKPILITILVFVIIYGLFVIRGYGNIARSSVLGMISASRQNEYVKQKPIVLIIKTLLGVGTLSGGYFLAVKDAGQEVMANVMAAVILVTVGVYLLFGGLIPLLLQFLQTRKRFLYYKQRCLWINSLIFRMKKNYRTYAMVCILILCAVSALATGFAMRYRYNNITAFENTYTFQLLGSQREIADWDTLAKQAGDMIRQYSDLSCQTQISMLSLEDGAVISSSPGDYGRYCILSYSEIARLAADTGLPLEFGEPEADEVIEVSHMPVLSLITDSSGSVFQIRGKSYRQIDETRVPYLGYLQESMNFLIVNEQVYESMLPQEELLLTSNYTITDKEAFDAAKQALDEWREAYAPELGRVAVNPVNHELDWLKIFHSMCMFMFLVFLLAGGSILFMKQYNDAFEEKERFQILRKMGISSQDLKCSVAKELGLAYAIPFLLMTVSSYFSVHALGNMMYTNLFSVNVVSVLVVLLLFLIFYGCSVAVYEKNAGL